MARRARHRVPGQRSSLAWRVHGLLVILLAGTSTFGVPRAGASEDEYAIRAAMILNLTRYIDWPAWKVDDTHPRFLICVLGADPIGADLDVLLPNKSVGAKPVLLRHLNAFDSADACHILYIGTGERKGVAEQSAELARNSVLTISERANADSPGQVIGLPTLEEHVHIDVDLGLARRSGLSISSKLLHLATVSY